MKRFLALISIIYLFTAQNSFAVAEETANQLLKNCLDGGGVGLTYFKQGHEDYCQNYKDGKKLVYETDPMQFQMIGSCECKKENFCWSGTTCVHIKDWCMKNTHTECLAEQKRKEKNYEENCPSYCKDGYEPSEEEKKILNSDLCKYSNVCGDKLPCQLVENECKKDFENMCLSVKKSCENIGEIDR